MKNLAIMKNLFSENGVQSIVFDLDGTLYSSHAGLEYQIKPKVREHIAKALDVSEGEVRVLVAQYHEQYGSYLVGLRDHHGVEPVGFLKMVYDDLDHSRIVPYIGLDECIGRLSSIAPLYLLTNSNRSHSERVLEILGLRNYFQNIFSVEDSGFLLKPNPSVYEQLLVRLGHDASSVVVFDDSYLNLKVAHGMGMHTVLVSNGIGVPPLFWEMHRRESHDVPDFVDLFTHDITALVKELCSM